MKELQIRKSIFKQVQKRFLYEVSEYSGLIYRSEQKVLENKIFECNLEMPILQKGDKFYIEELDKAFTIAKYIRTSQDNALYYVQDEIIEDEISLKFKADAEALRLVTIAKIDKEKETADKANEDFESQVRKSFWFRFIKIRR